MENDLDRFTTVVDELERQSQEIGQLQDVVVKLRELQKELDASRESFSAAVADYQSETETMRRFSDEVRSRLGELSSWLATSAERNDRLQHSISALKPELAEHIDRSVIYLGEQINREILRESAVAKNEIIGEIHRSKKFQIKMLAIGGTAIMALVVLILL